MSDWPKIWVHTDGWAGRNRHPGHLVKQCPKRSKVRFDYAGMAHVRYVPNHAITPRQDS